MAGADVTESATEKVVILGGGVGGVSAAIALSHGNWHSRFESITLYQQGWRLGGKGASGRGDQLRIEEHGLHIWFGFYENAFRMLRECHEELDTIAATNPADPTRQRWELVATNMEDSFTAGGPITLTDHDGCRWKPWAADFTKFDDDRPWDAHDPRPVGERPLDWSVGYLVSRGLYLAVDVLKSLLPPEPTVVITTGSRPPPARASSASRQSALGRLERLVLELLGLSVRGVEEVLTTIADIIGSDAAGAAGRLFDLVLGGVDLATQLLRDRADELLRDHDEVRRAWYIADLALAVTRGVLRDGVLAENDFSVVNHMDFRQWLLSHGAARESADSALVRAVVYDLAFGYEDGDPTRPAAEAGTALRGLMRTFFTYRGAIMWKMKAGMGDIVFAPLYELLEKRGVTIRFFHRVEQVHADENQVTRIDIDVQAVMAPHKPQQLLSPSANAVKAPTGRWPAEPAVRLIRTPPEICHPRDYESYLLPQARVGCETLARGGDFDRVVYAMPISTVPHIGRDLLPKWGAAVEHVKTTPTQALQLWLRKPISELSDYDDGAVVGGFTEPFDTWVDMNQVVPERLVVGAKTVAYLCNVLPHSDPPVREDPGTRKWLEDQDDLVRAYTERFLREDVRHLWPYAVDPVTGELDWTLLVAPDDVQGSDRLDHQYLRANVDPSERYVLSVPGSSAHRIDPGDTGFSNLYAAGDWTRCGLDAGCVEAATISGLLAANAILTDIGQPTQARPITGHPSP